MKKSLDGIFTMLRKIYREQKKQTKILQAIENSKEQSVSHKCLICKNPAELKLETGQFICDTCAQIQGERSEF